MSQPHEYAPDAIAAATRKVTEGFSARTPEVPAGGAAVEPVKNIRRPPPGEPLSSDPHDSWAPLILPVHGIRRAERGWERRHNRMLGETVNGLGYPMTRHWEEALLVAENWSQGNFSEETVARASGVTVSAVREREADLRAIFGNLPLPALIDKLFREQFLSFTIQGVPPVLDERASQMLAGLADGTATDPDEYAYRPLYWALSSPPTRAAAIRRAYELQLRKPLGVASARRVGFHLLQGAEVPDNYPGQPMPRTTYKRAWNVTKRVLEGKIRASEHYALPRELTVGELTVASLIALGCRNEEIAERTGLDFRTVTDWLGRIGTKTQDRVRDAKMYRLFLGDTFFVTQSEGNKEGGR
jgi:DNA-binding CsgD family transcriptional regulator